MNHTKGLQPPGRWKAVVEPITVAGNQLTIYAEAAPLFAAMIADIASAQRRVWVETYIFADDGSGHQVAEALAAKASSGVQTRLLYDAIGSILTKKEFFTDLRKQGVDVHAYHTFFEALRRFSPLRIMNRRDHRKLLIVDDDIAYFGGMNIVDHGRDFRFMNTPEEAAPTLGWRDFHVRLVGPAARQVAASFERSWDQAHGRMLTARPKAYRRVHLPQHDESIHFFDSGHGLGYSRADRVFRRILRGTQRESVIAMAYFVPVRRVLGAILRLRRQGRRVLVVVPALGDMPLVRHASQYLYRKLLNRGIRIFERSNRMLHGKLVIVDKRWTICGSSNMDPRSLWINLEFLAVIKSEAFARAARGIVAYEVMHSRRVAPHETRPLHIRLLCGLAWLLRWWL